MPILTQHAFSALADRLAARQRSGLLRQLRTADILTDFCSNDYLGLARSPELRLAIQRAEAGREALPTGATGSRLLSGQSELANEVEHQLAEVYQTETALIFNSGYDANLGLLACLPQVGDTLLTDELIHASMIDGARLSYATRRRFRHNDLADLDCQLRLAAESSPLGQVFVAVESLYSMDGDIAPLGEMADLCDNYGAALIVDEAHATGMYGPTGEGLTVALGLQERVFARVHTFSKALGVHGAAVVGPAVLRDYLINFARPFIYSTALPPHSLLAIRCAHEHLQTHPDARRQLQDRLAYFWQRIAVVLPDSTWSNSQSPIQCLIVPGNDTARLVATAAQSAGFDVRAILSPTVPTGQERLRICIHAYNTEAEIDRLIDILSETLFHI